MVYSLPVLIFCFINIFNSTWADACNSLSSTHQGNDENFNNRNIFRSIFFEHALRREPRMVNVCERVGTERLVNNRRIVDSDSRITNFPARDGTNARIQNSRIDTSRAENNPKIVRNNVRSEDDRESRYTRRNAESRSSNPTTFQRRNIPDSRDNRVTRNEVRSRNLDASRQTDRNSRVDPKDSFARSRSVRSLPDVSRFNDLERSIRVVRDSHNNVRISSRLSRNRVQDEASIRNSQDSSRQDRTVRISRDVRSRSVENIRMARDSRTNERISGDLSRQDRTVRISRDVRSKIVEDLRMARDSRASRNVIRQVRAVRLSRERVGRNANDVRSISVADREASIRMARDSRATEKISRNLIRQVRAVRIVEDQDASVRMDRDSRTNERLSRNLNRQVRISRERVGRNANNVRSRSVEDQDALVRMNRDSRTNERLSRNLNRQVRISRERVGRNANEVRSRSVEDQDALVRMNRDSRTNERLSRNLIRQVRISRERVGRNANEVRSRSVEDREALIRLARERISPNLIRQNRFQNGNRRIQNIQRVRDEISRDLIRVDRTPDDRQSRSFKGAELRATGKVRNDRNTERISRDLIRQDRTVRVSRDRNTEMVRDSRNNERISRDLIRQDRMVRVPSDPEVLIRMARDSRNNVIRQDRTIRISRERVDRNAIRDSRNLIRMDNVRSKSLEASIRTIRKSRENERLTRTDRDARNQNFETSDRRVREDGFRQSQSRTERNARLSRETSRNIQPLERDSIRSARNIRDDLQFVVITKNTREEKDRQIDFESRKNQAETRRPELEMRSINARFLIKDENNNDVDDNSSRLLFLNGKLSSWSNALSTILGILFVAHVLSTSSNTKKSPVKYFSSLFSYQKEKVF